MPILKCSTCKKLQSIRTIDWKLVSKIPFDNVCSRQCFLKWIIVGAPVSLKTRGLRMQSHSICTGVSYSNKLDRFFRSNYEVRVAEYLEFCKINFLYESIYFEIGNKKYIPDFFLPEYNSFIEVKGLWGSSSKTKYINLKKKYPDIRILLLSWLVNKEF